MFCKDGKIYLCSKGTGRESCPLGHSGLSERQCRITKCSAIREVDFSLVSPPEECSKYLDSLTGEKCDYSDCRKLFGTVKN